MTQFYTAGQLYMIIRDICQNEMDDLGPDDDSKLQAVFRIINLCSWALPRVHYLVSYSDELIIEDDGYVTFQHNGIDVSDLFEPMMILDSNTMKMQQRTSDDAPIGWYRASHNVQIHIRGFHYVRPLTPGPYTLKYLKYPKQVTQATDMLEIAPAGYQQLVYDTAKMIKLTRNSYAGSDFMQQNADQKLMQTVQGAISGMGVGSGTTPPSAQDVRNARGMG